MSDSSSASSITPYVTCLMSKSSEAFFSHLTVDDLSWPLLLVVKFRVF